MPVTGFDHAAIPTGQPEELIRFYEALGFTILGAEDLRAGRRPFFSIVFGPNKINVHAPALWQNPEFTLRGPGAVPGCGDFCFVWEGSQAELDETLARAGAEVEVGPVQREGGRDGGSRSGTSTYTRDPDGNLLEFIIYD